MSENEILDQLDKNAADFLAKYHGCAMATLYALREQFNLMDPSLVRAATFLQGVASRGETCGAALAGLIALGLIFCPDDLSNLKQRKKMHDEKATTFCQRFEKEFGSLMCRDIQKLLFGRSFNMLDPEDRDKFISSEPSKTCCRVTGKAVRIAGELILEGMN